MAYNETLAQRLREALSHRSDLQEEGMYGGLAFKVSNHKCIGVLNDDLMARVGPDKYQEALTLPHARPMDLMGAPIPGFVMVKPDGVTNDDDLKVWVNLCETFADSLPPK